MYNDVIMDSTKIKSSSSSRKWKGKVSAYLNVLQPKSEDAYLISQSQWNGMKGKLFKIKSSNPFYFIFGSTFLSGSFSFIIGACSLPSSEIQLISKYVIAFVVTLIIGLILIGFAILKKKEQDHTVLEVLEQMEEVENRFRDEVT